MGGPSTHPHLDEKPHTIGAIVFLLVLAERLGFVAFSASGEGRADPASRRISATG